MEQSTRAALEALEQNPADRAAFERVEEAYMVARDWRALTDLFERFSETLASEFKKYWQRLIEELEIVIGESEPSEQSQIQVAIGRIWENRLDRGDQAMMAYQRAFKVFPMNGEALDLARDIYARDNNWQMVAKLWILQMRVVQVPAEQVKMRTGLARVLYDRLGDKAGATNNLNQALEIDPNNAAAQELLDIIEGRFVPQEVTLDSLKQAIEESVGDERVETIMNLAQYIVDEEPEDAPNPTELVREALTLQPELESAKDLEYKLLEKEEAWGDMAERLRGSIASEVDRDKKLTLLLQLANVLLHIDEAEAISTFRQVLELDPTHSDALAQASIFYERSGDWEDLIAVYEVAIKAAGRGAQSADLLAKTAEIYWKRLEDHKAAEKHFKKLRLMDARNETMLRFYVERYRADENWSRLLSSLQTLRDVGTDSDEQIAYALEMADVAETKLKKASKAIDVWKWVLRHEPGHVDARRELHRLYTDGKKWNALLDLLKGDVDALGDDQVEEKVRAYREMIEIYRDRLRLDVMVINTHIALLQVAPGDIDAIDALAARYAASSRWNDYVGILGRKVEAVDDEATKIDLLRQIADTWRTKLGNISRAVVPLEDILNLVPTDQEAIDQLKEIYTARRDYKKLVAVQQKEIALLEPEAQVAALREMATVVRKRLKDEELLAKVYIQLLEVTEAKDEEAATELIAIYDRGDQWEALAAVIQQLHDHDRAELGQTLRLADLYDNHLDAQDQAIGIWRAVLDAHPDEQEARARLTQALHRQGDWDGLEALGASQGDMLPTLDLFEVSAHQVDDDEAISLYERVGRIAAELGQADRQTAAYESILGLSPNDDNTMGRLAALYRSSERFRDLAVILERRISNSEGDAAAALRQEVAEVYAQNLDEPALAYERYVTHFEADPTNTEVRGRLLELALQTDRAEAWFETFKTLCATMPRGDARVDNYRALGRLAAGPIQSPGAAIDFFQRVRQALPEDREALTSLTLLFRDAEQWEDLVGVLDDTKAIATPEEIPSLAMERAELLSVRLGRPEEALASLEEVLALDAESLPALRGLRKTYGATG